MNALNILKSLDKEDLLQRLKLSEFHDVAAIIEDKGLDGERFIELREIEIIKWGLSQYQRNRLWHCVTEVKAKPWLIIKTTNSGVKRSASLFQPTAYNENVFREALKDRINTMTTASTSTGNASPFPRRHVHSEKTLPSPSKTTITPSRLPTPQPLTASRPNVSKNGVIKKPPRPLPLQKAEYRHSCYDGYIEMVAPQVNKNNYSDDDDDDDYLSPNKLEEVYEEPRSLNTNRDFFGQNCRPLNLPRIDTNKISNIQKKISINLHLNGSTIIKETSNKNFLDKNNASRGSPKFNNYPTNELKKSYLGEPKTQVQKSTIRDRPLPSVPSATVTLDITRPLDSTIFDKPFPPPRENVSEEPKQKHVYNLAPWQSNLQSDSCQYVEMISPKQAKQFSKNSRSTVGRSENQETYENVKASSLSSQIDCVARGVDFNKPKPILEVSSYGHPMNENTITNNIDIQDRQASATQDELVWLLAEKLKTREAQNKNQSDSSSEFSSDDSDIEQDTARRKWALPNTRNGNNNLESGIFPKEGSNDDNRIYGNMPPAGITRCDPKSLQKQQKYEFYHATGERRSTREVETLQADEEIDNDNTRTFNLQDEPFYRNINRKEARLLLQGLDDGAFLIRPSMTFFLGLTIKYKRKCYDFGIQKVGNKICLNSIHCSDSPTFRSLRELIDYFITEPVTFRVKNTVVEIILKPVLPPVIP